MELGKVENLWVDIRSTSMTGPGLMKITNLARKRLKTKTENVKLFSPTLFHSPVSWSRMKEHVGQRWPPVSKICKTNPDPLVKKDRMQKITPLRQKAWLHNHQWTLPASTKANAN